MIVFNKPYMTGNELSFISKSHSNGRLAGDGPFTEKCHRWLEKHSNVEKALLTHSCTAALEISALLLNLQPGDEVIMPSFTFVSTANAFVIRGAIPVFVDIRKDTLNIDETLIESAITSRTRAIVPVHYAGVGCEMDTILRIATKYDIAVIEDAAQGIMAKYKGKPLGSIGHIGAYSFHETKNLICGEGGALLVNDPKFSNNAEIIREKGTDRSRFFRGEIDKYTWQDVGSSFLPGELNAAFLWAQFEASEYILNSRLTMWYFYHENLEALESTGMLQRPNIPEECQHNAHMYYIILNSDFDRNAVIQRLKKEGISSVFHYVPLHSSPAGKRFGRVESKMTNTNSCSKQLLRLPMWIGLRQQEQATVISKLTNILFDLKKH